MFQTVCIGSVDRRKEGQFQRVLYIRRLERVKTMSKLGARMGVRVMGTMLLLDLAAAQEHVRLTPQLGMFGVLSAAFSPNGRFVVTNGGDEAAQLWDVATGQQLRSFEGHKGRIFSVAFSQDSRFVLTGSGDGTARLWDAVTGQQLRSFEGHRERILCVAFSPDGRFVLTGSGDGGVRLWDAAAGLQLRSFEGHKELVFSVAFSPDSRFVLTGSGDGTARLWMRPPGNRFGP